MIQHYATKSLAWAFGLVMVLFAQTATAQVFTGTPDETKRPALDPFFYQAEVFKFDATAMKNWLLEQPSRAAEVRLQLGNHHLWKMNLAPANLVKPGTMVTTSDENGHLVEQPFGYDPTYEGSLADGSGKVALVINDEHLGGAVIENGVFYNIQPLYYFDKTAAHDEFVVYKDSDAKPTAPFLCGAIEAEKKAHELEEWEKNQTPEQQESQVLACYQVDMAIATASTMNSFYGSTAQVQNYVLGIYVLVNSVYTGNFIHDLNFVITDWHNSTSTAMDGWGQTTNSSQLLTNFTNWGNAGNFGSVYDLAQLWDHTTWQGGVAGIAWLSAVCTANRYSCISDWTSNQCFMKVTTAHELGHNFSAVHDGNGQPFIMAPVVNCTDTWSSLSISSINNYIPTKIGSSCLTACAGGAPPVAEFTYSPSSPVCKAAPIQFTDQSTNNPTSWAWVFPSGTPATSTLQNPTVTWNVTGTFTVTLTATNAAGSNSKTHTITVNPLPTANFTYVKTLNVVAFTNTSQNSTSYFWDFGDGMSSTLTSPTHTYADDGTYIVELTAFNTCGQTVKSITIVVVTPPTAQFAANPTTGCAPETVVFENQSSANATSFAWNMPGAVPAFSTQFAPTVVYPNPGTYSVTLTAYNSLYNDQEIKVNYIHINSAPTPNFSSSANMQTVTFTNLTMGGATSYLWNFGDGQTSTATNPVHTYAMGGTYVVTLTATNACGDNQFSQTIVVENGLPIANFTASPTTGCGPLTVQFTNQSTGASTYHWTFAGGTPVTSTLENPVVVYQNPGSYGVTLTATNASGNNTLSQANFITVLPAATANFTYSKTDKTVTFTNTSQNATSYSWNFGDGQSSTVTNPVHTYATDGTYTVILTASNTCGSVDFTQTIQIVTPVTAGFSANNLVGCPGMSVQFTNSSSANATNWAWTFAGGTPATSTAQNPTVIYNTPGTYGVTLTASNSGYSATSTQTNYITVNQIAIAGFTSSSNGLTVTFTNTSQNAVSYHWDFGDGTTSTAANPVHTYPSNGNYIVTLMATNACGTTNSVQSVSLNVPPMALFSPSTTSGCAALTVVFTNQSSSNSATFDWQFPGGTPSTSTAQNPTVVYQNPGTFTASLTVTNGAGSSTYSTVITALPTAAASFTSQTVGSTTAFTNTSQNATSYIWDFGDGVASTLTNPTHTYSADGSYTVVLTATNSCGSTTYIQTVTILTPPTAGFTTSGNSGCAALTVVFTNASSANSATFDWQFPGGTPASSTEQSPTVVYQNPGTFTATLTVSNGAGSSTTTATITVGGPPTAGFTTAGAGFTKDFTNTSTNASSYIWTFGDGMGSTDQNPSHTYAANGAYVVTLKAINACDTTTYVQNILVVTTPAAGFSANQTTGCQPLTVTFSSLFENATSLEWTFDGGTPSSSVYPTQTVSYDHAGTFDVVLTVQSAAGPATYTASNFITVLPQPTAGFTSATTGLHVDFLNTSTAQATSTWDFGDGTGSSDENPSHDYLTDGSYIVVLTTSNGCGVATSTQVVTVVTPPTAAFSANQTSGCAPFEVSFTNQSSANATSFEWSFPGGSPTTSIDINPNVTYSIPGIYDVTLTAMNAAGQAVSTQTGYITVGLAPTAGYTFQTAGLSVILTNTSTGTGNSYHWDFGDGSTSTDENPTHAYATTGSYVVSLTTTNACGSATTLLEIQISGSAPIPAINAAPSSGCLPLVVQFTDQSAGSPTSWLWGFPGGSPATSTDQNPSVTYSVSGTYDVSLKVTNAFGSSTQNFPAMIQAAAPPVVGFTYSISGLTTVSFTNLTSNATTFLWNFGDGTTSTEQNPTHVYSGPGQYVVVLTATNICQSNTVQQTVVLVIGTSETDWLSKFLVYPNPTSGDLTLELEGAPSGDIHLSVLDVLGRQVVENQGLSFAGGSLKKSFDLSSLPAATYIVRLQTGERTAFLKVVVQK